MTKTNRPKPVKESKLKVVKKLSEALHKREKALKKDLKKALNNKKKTPPASGKALQELIASSKYGVCSLCPSFAAAVKRAQKGYPHQPYQPY